MDSTHSIQSWHSFIQKLAFESPVIQSKTILGRFLTREEKLTIGYKIKAIQENQENNIYNKSTNKNIINKSPDKSQDKNSNIFLQSNQSLEQLGLSTKSTIQENKENIKDGNIKDIKDVKNGNDTDHKNTNNHILLMDVTFPIESINFHTTLVHLHDKLQDISLPEFIVYCDCPEILKIFSKEKYNNRGFYQALFSVLSNLKNFDNSLYPKKTLEFCLHHHLLDQVILSGESPYMVFYNIISDKNDYTTLQNLMGHIQKKGIELRHHITSSQGKMLSLLYSQSYLKSNVIRLFNLGKPDPYLIYGMDWSVYYLFGYCSHYRSQVLLDKFLCQSLSWLDNFLADSRRIFKDNHLAFLEMIYPFSQVQIELFQKLKLLELKDKSKNDHNQSNKPLNKLQNNFEYVFLDNFITPTQIFCYFLWNLSQFKNNNKLSNHFNSIQGNTVTTVAVPMNRYLTEERVWKNFMDCHQLFNQSWIDYDSIQPLLKMSARQYIQEHFNNEDIFLRYVLKMEELSLKEG